jgi:hypothetical protein
MNRIILATLAMALASPAYASTISCSASWDSPFCTNEPPVYGSVEARCFMSPHRSDFVCKPGEVDSKGGQRVGVVWWAVSGGITDIAPELNDAPDAMEIIGGSKRTDELPFSPSAEAIDSELGEDQL